MKPKNQSRTTDYSSEDIARRRDDAIRRALNTPPKPYKDYQGRADKASAQAACGEEIAPRSACRPIEDHLRTGRIIRGRP